MENGPEPISKEVHAEGEYARPFHVAVRFSRLTWVPSVSGRQCPKLELCRAAASHLGSTQSGR